MFETLEPKFITFAKTFTMKYLDPKNDLIFKKVFGEHPDILRSFLNAMLPLPSGQEIVELEYLSPEMIPETFLEKFTSVDVRCRDNFGRQFLVEMQMNWTTAFKQRVLFNASRAYVTQSDRGVEFRSLKPVYALNLINAIYLPQAADYYHHYAVVHLKDSNERLHGLEFVFIELEKFKARNIAEKKMQVLWLRFMTEINENTEQIAPELFEQPEIQKAITFVMEASLSKLEKQLYEKNWDRISSEKTLLSAALAEGEARGLAKGRREEKIEMAKKAKNLGMPVKDIINLTGLSEEEIMDI
jgi:predicted transposase/invertase (TIGR01784 family)